MFEHDNVACPLLCVVNQNLCPSSLAPTCSPGLQFCGDGTCQSSCDGIVNACQCGDDTIKYYPCAAGQLVNITHFDPVNQVIQIQNTCAASGNFSSLAVGTWGTSDATSVWLSCPVVEPYFTWTEPMWLAVWSLMAIEAAILALWAIYKKLREMRFHRSAQRQNKKVTQMNNESDIKVATKEEGGSSSILTESIQESEKLTFRGYRNDWFGYIGFSSVVVTTLLFFVFLGCIVGDYCNV